MMFKQYFPQCLNNFPLLFIIAGESGKGKQFPYWPFLILDCLHAGVLLAGSSAVLFCPPGKLLQGSLWNIEAYKSRSGRDLGRSFCPTPCSRHDHP